MTIDQNKHVADNDDLATKLAYVATVLRDAVVRYRVFEAHYRKQSKHEIRREDMVEANSTATQKALIDALAMVEHASRLAADVARGVEDLDQRKDAEHARFAQERAYNAEAEPTTPSSGP